MSTVASTKILENQSNPNQIHSHAASLEASFSNEKVISSHQKNPNLLADVGGTNARFGLEYSDGETKQITEIKTYKCSEFKSLSDVIREYLSEKKQISIEHAAIAIANPVNSDQVKMTNHDWSFSIKTMREELNLKTLCVVNDFAALALAVPALKSDEKRQIGDLMSSKAKKNVMGVLGSGTGLGVAGVLPIHDKWVPLASEGGHATFAATTPIEQRILSYARRLYTEHVSYERIVSGPGIKVIYAALAERDGKRVERGLLNANIVERAHDGDKLAREVINTFCSILGSFAGNVAVTLAAVGGIYIGGGVVPKLGDLFDRSPFRERFEAKGRFQSYLERIPTFVITSSTPAFIGASVMLNARLAGDTLIGGH